MDKKAVFKALLVCFVVMTPSVSAFHHPSFLLEQKNDFFHLKKECPDENMTETLEYKVCFSEPEIKEKNDVLQVEVKEANSYLKKPGEPILPCYSMIFIFPLGTKIVDLKFTASQPREIQFNKKNIKTLQPQNYPWSLFQIELSEENSGWCTWRTGGGIEHGKHVTFLSVQIIPVKYDKQRNVFLFVEKTAVQITIKKPALRVEENDSYDLLIISPRVFKKTLNKLVEHKNKHGVSTKLVTLNEIFTGKYFETTGRDKPEQIKYFIYNAFRKWGVDFVLLVGNVNRLPMRETWMGTGKNERTVLTDLYYADLCFGNGTFCNWDSNKNGYYGEVWHAAQDDLVDLYPDVYLGRLACNNLFELNTVVDKIISYENGAYAKSWSKKMILIGGDTFPSDDDFYEGEFEIDKIAESTPTMTHVMLKTSENNFSYKRLNDEINRGAGFVGYSGHGFETGVGTHPPKDDEWVDYQMYHLLGLRNKDKLPIVFFSACLTGRLDYNILNLFADIWHYLLKMPRLAKPELEFPVLFPCFAWATVAQPNGGAVAAIGATRVAYDMINESGIYGGGCYLSWKFFESLSKSTYVSEMLVSAKNDYLNNVSWWDPFTLE